MGKLQIDTRGLAFFNDGDMSFDKEKESKLLKDNLDWLKSLDVRTFTFYKKWEEMHMFVGDDGFVNKATRYKSHIWQPTDIENEEATVKEIENLQPEVTYAPIENEAWNIIRTCCHTAEFNQSPGRFLKFFVVDKITQKYLGFLAIASDVITITDRDKYIGWTADNRVKDKRLEHSAIGTTIAPTQPFGYNFLGGKLCAALTTSGVIRSKWQEIYDSVLVGMTTTSLYGTYSMYNSLKWWHACGASRGQILIKPDEIIYKRWHEYIKQARKTEYDRVMTQKEGISGPVTSAKLRILNMIFNEAGLRLKSYVHGHERGVYSSLFYENSKEFFQNKIPQSALKMKPLFAQDVDAIIQWWKPKAIARYRKLKVEGRLQRNVLYYRDMMEDTFEDAKLKYLGAIE